MSDYFYAVLPTCLGWVGVVASDKGIRKLALPQSSPQGAVDHIQPEASNAELAQVRFEDLRQQLESHFCGEPTTYEQKLDLEGAPAFFVRAWEACRSIPRGKTQTYSWLATQAGNPKAVRAAGQAMAHNPVTIIIPCHRVIGSDGSLRGFGGGLGLKQRLLELERDIPL